MQISINANYLRRQYGTTTPRPDADCFRLCADAGFRTLDHTVPHGDDRWLDRAAHAADTAAAMGLTLEQSHAPFNRYAKRPIDEYTTLLHRSIQAAARMGNRQIVIHADDYRPDPADSYSFAGGLEAMYNFWAPFVEEATSLGVDVAIETLFEDGGKPYPTRFTSKLEELVALIDRFDDPRVTCCWDSGHARLAFTREGMSDAMRTLGRRITCTHIHDNYYKKDLHLTPFIGDIDWAEQMRTLREIGYTGSLTFEFVYGTLPNELLSEFLKQAYRTGEHLVAMFEAE